jgi:hypothetical protein
VIWRRFRKTRCCYADGEDGIGLVLSAEPLEVTLFTKNGGGPLTKRICLAKDGSIISDGSACIMTRGTARRVHLDHIGDFADLIKAMQPNEAVALGVLRDDLPDKVRIVTKAKLSGARPHTIARTSSNLSYRKGQAALALLDHDTKGMPAQVRARLAELGGFWPALVTVLHELSTVAHVTRRSTSAGMTRADTGEELPGSDGQHIYLMVTDGSDGGRFLRALHVRCWLAGLGWMMVGASGQLLERSIVDRMVDAPERLVFEGAPVLAVDRSSRAAIWSTRSAPVRRSPSWRRQGFGS